MVLDLTSSVEEVQCAGCYSFPEMAAAVVGIVDAIVDEVS